MMHQSQDCQLWRSQKPNGRRIILKKLTDAIDCRIFLDDHEIDVTIDYSPLDKLRQIEN